MAQFRVTADKLWHSGECRHYFRGDTINLPDTTTVKPGGSIELIEPPKPAKAPASKGKTPEGADTGDKAQGDESLA